MEKILTRNVSNNITNKKSLVKYVSAMVLGDGFISKSSPDRKNYQYRINQIDIHLDYIQWQADILSNLTKIQVYKTNYIDKRGWNTQPQLSLRTGALPFFTTIRERTYINGKKVISPHDLKLLDWETVAILYMDDGHLEQKGNYVRINIATDGYSFGDISLLQKAIYQKLNISFDIKRRKNVNNVVYRLYSSKDNAKRFLEGISKIIVPSFEYKLGSF